MNESTAIAAIAAIWAARDITLGALRYRATQRAADRKTAAEAAKKATS